MNKDNAAAASLGPSAAGTRATEVSQGGAVKTTALAGAIFKHKDDKKGQQDTFRHFFEAKLGYMINFPGSGLAKKQQAETQAVNKKILVKKIQRETERLEKKDQICAKLDAVIPRLDPEDIRKNPGTCTELDLQLDWYWHNDSAIPMKKDVKKKDQKVEALIEAVIRSKAGAQQPSKGKDREDIGMASGEDMENDDDDNWL